MAWRGLKAMRIAASSPLSPSVTDAMVRDAEERRARILVIGGDRAAADAARDAIRGVDRRRRGCGYRATRCRRCSSTAARRRGAAW